MIPLTKNTEYTFKPELYRDLPDNEKEKLIYKNSILLQTPAVYRKITIQIIFNNIDNIPDTIQIYCFKTKTDVQKETLYHDVPGEFFSFSKHNLLYPSQKYKSKELLIDVISDFNDNNFIRKEPYLIDRIGFFVENANVEVEFGCEVFGN